MCRGFGIVCSRELNLYFTHFENMDVHNCSHAEILWELGWQDTEVFNRRFIRIEFPNWKANSFNADEYQTLPGWAENNLEEIKNKSIKLLEKILPFYEEFKLKNGKILDKYNEVMTTEFLYSRKQWALVNERLLSPDVCMKELREYSKKQDAKRARLLKQSTVIHKEFINSISKIDGYIGRVHNV